MARTIKKIILHCTDSDDSLDIGFNEIDQWHKARGWDGCGYHFIIRRDGRIEIGRPAWKVGAHVNGHNKHSIGVVCVGRKEPSREQWVRLLDLIRALMNQYNLKNIEDILGHTEIDHLKTCPNISMVMFRGHLLFHKLEWVGDDIKELVAP